MQISKVALAEALTAATNRSFSYAMFKRCIRELTTGLLLEQRVLLFSLFFH